MSRKAVSRSFSSVPFSFSMLTLMVASSFPATAGKFNPRFLEDVEGVSQHIDLAMYESGPRNNCPGHIVFP